MRTAIDWIRAVAGQKPAQPAVVAETSETGVSYAELVAHFEARAASLRESGLQAGERCGLIASQGYAFIESALGVMAAGGCIVPIPDGTQGSALERICSEAALDCLIEESQGFELQRLNRTASNSTLPEDRFRALNPAYLRFTSGTTQHRKGVVLSHAAILQRLENANQGLAISGDDRILWLLPMAHHFVVSILLYLRFGATILLPGQHLARPILDFAKRERATFLYASPYHYQLLAKDTGSVSLPDVRMAVSTADGLRPEIARGFRARFGIPLTQALGIIEVGLPVLNTRHAADKPSSLGRPLPAYDVWLRSEDGKRLDASSPDNTGEICVRGSGLLDAYLQPWLPADQILLPDGFRTGDQGWFDADGDLFLAGRRGNRINMAGMKFFAEEVEFELSTHPGIDACRVFGREHAHLGEIPVAEIVPVEAPGPSRGELTRFCRDRLPAYKIPREFVTVSKLAETATGKIARRKEGDA